MNSNFYRLVFICLLTAQLNTVVNLTLAQEASKQITNYEGFVSPSINSSNAALTSVGNNGAVRLSIPLTSFSTDFYTIPVSLSYYSGGTLVSQESSQVGLNWSLQAGGMISREVRDQADDINSPVGVKENLDMNDPIDKSYVQDVAENETRDSEPDLFSYQFAGGQGTFVLDATGAFVPLEHRNWEISVSNDMTVFTVKTDDGMLYKFGTVDGEKNEQDDSSVTTAWYLVNVIHPTGQQIVFTYEKHTIYSTQKGFQYKLSSLNSAQPCGAGFSESSQQIQGETVEYQTPFVSTISSYGWGSCSFEYDTSGENVRLSAVSRYDSNQSLISQSVLDYSSVNGRHFLDKVTHKGSDGIEVSNYAMTYYNPSGLPAFDSFAQDHWGYYNGATTNDDNNQFVPKNNVLLDVPTTLHFGLDGADREANALQAQVGMLESIKYPSGKTVYYEYEGHEVEDVIKTAGAPTILSRGLTAPSGAGSKDYQFLSYYNQTITLNIDVQGTPGVGSSGTLKVWDELSQSYVPGLSNYNIEADGEVSFSGVQGVYYKLELVANSTNNVAVSFDQKEPTIVESTGTVAIGGVRLKVVTALDGSSGRESSTRYYYGPKESYAVSSGVTYEKYPYRSYYSNTTLTQEGEDCEYIILSSHSRNLLHKSGNEGVQYEYVTVSKGGDNFENGGYQMQYNIGAQSAPEVVSGNPIQDSPWSNDNWNRGLLKSRETFKKEGESWKVLERVTTLYDLKAEHSKTIPAYVIRKRYESQDDPEYQRYDASGYNYHVYKPKAYQVVTEMYDENADNPIESTTHYHYDNSEHPYLTRVETLDSEGKTKKTTTKYPQDFASPGSLISTMVGDRFLNAPIEIITEENGTVVKAAAVAYEYDTDYNYFSVKETLQFEVGSSFTESNNGESFHSSYQWQRRVLKRDDQGHTLSEISRAGVPTTYIRGHGGKYVVAAIVNATYDEVMSALGLNANLRLSGELSVEQNTTLRNQLSNARVSSYTYQEGVGVTSSQDPNGRVSYHTYDPAGRSKHTKDHNGHVRSTQSYYIK
ncbi:hypothetical protein [Reichenbachiella sp.]|uniref:hypothetical protein n=1 Tax=Reichenbachiella sp. TaxID=2184521 RepID=UPI003BB1552F